MEDKLSPWSTPAKLEKKGERSPINDTHDLIPWYMLKITINTVPSMLCSNIFFYRHILHTESNANEKSTKQQNIFFFCDFKTSIRACIEKIWSRVE